jgi:hypothetical protein
MRKRNVARIFWTAGILIGLLSLPITALAKEGVQEWILVNPEGVTKIEPMKVNPHPTSLQGKTVLLRWNGKHNGDNFLNRVAELLTKEVKDIKIIKSWVVAPETAIIAGNPERSQQFVKKLSSPRPDIVIASQCD